MSHLLIFDTEYFTYNLGPSSLTTWTLLFFFSSTDVFAVATEDGNDFSV